MSNPIVANTVGAISSLFVLLGITGVTAQDVAGFVNVILALVAFASFFWSQFAHKKALTAAKGL